MNFTFLKKNMHDKRQEDPTLDADSGKSVTYSRSFLAFFFIQLSRKYLYIPLMVRKGKCVKINTILVASHLRYVG